MNHNLLGSVNEVHLLVDDSGRPHIDKIVRGETLEQVLDVAGYNSEDLKDNFRNIVRRAEAQSAITNKEMESLCKSYSEILGSYTYLED